MRKCKQYAVEGSEYFKLLPMLLELSMCYNVEYVSTEGLATLQFITHKKALRRRKIMLEYLYRETMSKQLIVGRSIDFHRKSVPENEQ